MSMPKFPKRDEVLPRCIAIDAILTSIAAEEVALSHIINAEGEKIQYALSQCKDIQRMLEVNASVADILSIIVDLQMIIKTKMRLAERFLETEPSHNTKYIDKC